MENTSPFIRIEFDEDEYPGDTFKTVTLTKADLTMPDGETMSVLDGFATTDWITYLWGGVGPGPRRVHSDGERHRHGR